MTVLHPQVWSGPPVGTVTMWRVQGQGQGDQEAVSKQIQGLSRGRPARTGLSMTAKDRKKKVGEAGQFLRKLHLRHPGSGCRLSSE